MSTSFFVPNSSISHCTVEKKSRFVTSVSEIRSKDEALEHIEAIVRKEVGASHNCYAYIVGNPSSPIDVHCSDDGEPSGTAGRPMLNILQHENIGNVLVVVTRYFGGIKLGCGGLVRAYSNGLKMALAETGLREYVQKKRIKISFHYQFEGVLRHICLEFGATILDATYQEGPCFTLELVERQLDPFCFKIRDITSGQIKIDVDM